MTLENNITLHKSCRGLIDLSNNVIGNIIYTSDHIYDITTFMNGFIIDKYENIGPRKYKIYGYHPQVSSYLKQYKWNKKYATDKLLTRFLRKGPEIICPITENDYRETGYENMIEKTYFQDIYNGYQSKIYKYLSGIGASIFFKIDSDIIITLDLQSSPISENDVVFWNNLVKDKKLVLEKINYLQKISFNIFNKTFDKNIHLIDKTQLKTYLLQVKQYGYHFMKDLIGQDFNKKLLTMTINPSPFFVKMALDDIFTGEKYIRYIDVYQNMKLDFIINLLETGQDIVYYDRFKVYDKKAYLYCKDNYLYKNNSRLQNIPAIPKIDTIKINPPSDNNTIPGIIGKELKIINASYSDIYEQKYCSHLFVCTDGSLFYNIRLKSINYAKLKNNDIYNKYFTNNINHVLKNSDHTIRYEKSNLTISEYYDKIPCYYEITVTEKDTAVKKYLINLIETPEIYYRDRVPINKNILIDPVLIIMFIYYRIKIDQILTENNIHLINRLETTTYPLLKGFITSESYLGKNYIILKRQMDNDDYYYLLWYIPKIIITDYLIFNNLIDYVENVNTKNPELIKDGLRELSNAVDDTYEKKIHNCIKKYIYDSTSYQKEYSGDQYVHNLRDIKKADIVEISQLLNLFYDNQYNNPRKFTKEDIFKFPYFAYVNYPNVSDFNTFHIHLFTFKSDVKNYKFNFINVRYIDNNASRPIPWEFIKYYDTSKISLIITVDLVLNITNGEPTDQDIQLAISKLAGPKSILGRIDSYQFFIHEIPSVEDVKSIFNLFRIPDKKFTIKSP
jgi:hypothetical protein